MNPLVATYLAKANQALHSARALITLGDVTGATNRAYYAAFYAASAALASVEEFPRTHQGIHRRFDYHFVRSGTLSADWSRTYRFLFDARHQADYDAMTVFDTDAAADLVDDAAAFVATEEVLLSRSTPD